MEDGGNTAHKSLGLEVQSTVRETQSLQGTITEGMVHGGRKKTGKVPHKMYG